MSANNCTVHHFTKDIRLLFVENDASTRALMLLLLQDYFDTIITAQDGLEGLHRFYEGNLDLIITDISMPQMDGVEMIQNIRENNPDIPIIVLSAYHDPLYILHTIRYNISGYIIKPAHRHQVEQEINKAVKLIRLETELEENRLRLESYKEFTKAFAKQKALQTTQSEHSPQLLHTLKNITNPLLVRFNINTSFIQDALLKDNIIQDMQTLDDRLLTMLCNYLNPKYYKDAIFRQRAFEYAVVSKESIYLEEKEIFFQTMQRLQKIFLEQFGVLLSININFVKEKTSNSKEIQEQVSSLNTRFIQANAKLQEASILL